MMLDDYKVELKEVVNQNENSLKEIIENCLNDIGKTPKEINTLKKFLTCKDSGVPYLNSKIQECLKSNNFEIKLSSVFSHGSPKVKFICPCQCKKKCNESKKDYCERELADLLVILRINDVEKTIYSTSFLSQWKLNAKDNQNEGQRVLYDNVTEFKMPNFIDKYNKGNRFFGDDKNKKLNFFYLDTKTFITRPAQTKISFSDVFIQLLSLDFGFPFDNNIWSGEDGNQYEEWDQLMDDLINKFGRQRVVKINGENHNKLFEFKIKDDEFFYEIINSETEKGKESFFQSLLIFDVNFNRNLRVERGTT